MGPVACVLFFLSIASAPDVSRTSADDEYDAALLKQHDVKADADGLLAFLRARTLDHAKVKHIRELVRQTGHPRFQVRDKAGKELLTIGVPALRFLEEASRDMDSEIAQRAGRLVEQIRNGPGPSLPIAALRQLRKHETAETLPTLIGFLPFADDLGVEEEALTTLVKFAVKDGRPDRRLREAAKDDFPARRAAAGYLLGRSTADEDREIARKLLGDKEAWVRFRTAEGLIAGRDKAAVPPLIDLAGGGPGEATWRAEEWLRRIAGDASPPPPDDDKAESRMAYREKWIAWWEKGAKDVNLANLTREPPVLGLWVGIEYNTNAVWECGRDGKRRWTIKAEGPMDAQVLLGNRVLVAEQTGHRVTERDLQGNILWEFKTDEETLNCQRLPNGNTFVATRMSVMEVRPNKTVVFKYKLSENYMHAVRRTAAGNFLGLTSGGEIREMNAAGKVVRTVQVPHEGTWGDVEALPGGRYLVSNYGSGVVREVDATGKTLREVKVPDACGLDRLPNGQLLISGQSKALITDWTGKSFWDVKSDGCVRRIHRR
jgi:hypothetical protein